MIKRTERGWAGHFICADRCMFRRNTLLEYENIKIVVSTVGNMRDFHAPDGFNKVAITTIGHERYFETMAFHAKLDKWLDADVSRHVYFDSPWALDKEWMEQEANDMHEKVVEEISEKLLKREKFEEKSYED